MGVCEGDICGVASVIRQPDVNRNRMSGRWIVGKGAGQSNRPHSIGAGGGLLGCEEAGEILDRVVIAGNERFDVVVGDIVVVLNRR